MGDVDDRDAVRLEVGHHPQQPLGLGEREARGRLVHDDDAGVHRQRLGDLDQLPLRDRQLGDRRAGLEVGAEPLQQGCGLGVHRPCVDQAEPPLLAPDEHVGGDVEVLEQVQFLMHEGDPGLGRPGHGHGRMGSPVDADFSSRRRHDAAQDLHQRAFAGAVLADQPQHLAVIQMQRHVAERYHARVGFGDPDQFQPVSRHRSSQNLPRPRRAGARLWTYFASSVFIVAWNSATLDLSITLVGMMICLLAGMNDLSPRITLSMSIID